MKGEEEFQAWIAAAEEAVRVAGEALRGGSFAALSEGEHDIKSAADLVANKRIQEILEKTGIPILSEEGGDFDWGLLDTDAVWVVDPLDGTVNFMQGNPLNCVSIALWKRREAVLGVVYDFVRDELYVGGRYKAACCNGELVRVSEQREAGRALLGTGFPSGVAYESAEIREFVESMKRFRKVRLLGSAALSLAWVARGWLDAYTEKGIYFWDVAAGLALVKAAGGYVRWESDSEDPSRGSAYAACSESLFSD